MILHIAWLPVHMNSTLLRFFISGLNSDTRSIGMPLLPELYQLTTGERGGGGGGRERGGGGDLFLLASN